MLLKTDLLDLRPEPRFLAGHLHLAASIPLEELPRRVHELPASSEPVRAVDDDPARAEAAAAFLRERGHEVATGAARPAGEALVEGPPGARLWRPAPFLERALEAIRAGGDLRVPPATAHALPPRPRSLDVACGTGRDAVFCALAGFEAEAIDILPDALERASGLARRSGVRLAVEARDLEADPTLPRGRWDLLTVFRFLWRPLFPALAAALAPGGFLVYETFHERTRETGRPPRSEAHLLRTGELRALCEGQGLEVRLLEDAVPIEGDGRFSSRIVARRPR